MIANTQGSLPQSVTRPLGLDAWNVVSFLLGVGKTITFQNHSGIEPARMIPWLSRHVKLGTIFVPSVTKISRNPTLESTLRPAGTLAGLLLCNP